MGDPDDGTPHQHVERLQAGPSRAPWGARVPAGLRLLAVAVVALVVGAAAGGGAVLRWQARPEPMPARADEHAVELVLFAAGAVRPGAGGSEAGAGPLRVDGALLLTGAVTSTILAIEGPRRGFEVRVPALPMTVSPSERYQAVSLDLVVRDCGTARRWTPGDRPFTVTWRDEYGRTHLDRAGDFGRPVARSLVRHVDAVC